VNITPKAIAVRILDKEYRVVCEEGEETALITSARDLDRRMREVRSSGKVIGIERIAVMVALNLANDLLKCQASHEGVANSAGHRLNQLRERIEIALNDSNQLEM
jgi:cell division protein ZapA